MTALAVALDTADVAQAAAWARAVAPPAALVKVGLELYLAHGPGPVAGLVPDGVGLFLDLKLHDIPTTVAGAVRSAVGACSPQYLTVHASGGAQMVQSAVVAAQGSGTVVTAVTVLTSLTDGDLGALGIAGPARDTVLQWSVLAVRAGAGALVCSPREVAAVRAAVGPGVVLICPGVRPVGSAAGDQARTATPQQAAEAGADVVVVGRPITGAPDPSAAAADLVASLR